MSDVTLPLEVRSLTIGALRLDVIGGPERGFSATQIDEHATVGSAPQGNTLTLSDEAVSRYHLELVRTPRGILVTDCGSTNGTWAGALRVERAVVPSGTDLRLGRSVVRVSDGGATEIPLYEGDVLGELRGRSPIMRRIMRQIEQVAQSDAPVLVQGESGTGKELVARALHERSARRDRPFVTVDCASLAPTLVASELFGHERGAFTGAERQHIGSFESVGGGTLFLDEIGELPPSLQPALLGALERKRIRRLGGTRDIPIDFRVVSATHRDLRYEVNNGTFRLDLFYRLSVVRLEMPPLRERLEDVPLLVEHFLRAAGRAEPREALISDAALASIARHSFPGNVRELRNVVEAALATGTVPDVEPVRPSSHPAGDAGAVSFELPYGEARKRLLDDFERSYIGRLLETSKGNVSLAARTAKMDRSHLVDLIRRHGLKKQ